MRITILALGSRGDVQPFMPLGAALQKAGHRVRVATFAAFASMIREAGLDFAPIQGDAQGLLNAAAAGGLLSGRTNPLQMLRALRRSYGTLANSLPRDIAALQNTDLVLNQLPAYLFGGDLAEYLGIPWAVVAVIPLMRTRTRPLVGFPAAFSWIPGYNTLTYRLAEQLGWQLFRKAVDRLRTEQWNLPAAPFWGDYEAIYQNGIPFICGFSPYVVPRPADWGPQIHLTGWWIPEDRHWAPPAELERFIEAGQPPVFHRVWQHAGPGPGADHRPDHRGRPEKRPAGGPARGLGRFGRGFAARNLPDLLCALWLAVPAHGRSCPSWGIRDNRVWLSLRRAVRVCTLCIRPVLLGRAGGGDGGWPPARPLPHADSRALGRRDPGRSIRQGYAGACGSPGSEAAR